MHQLYQRVAPRPEDFPRLLGKIGESTAKDFDFTEGVRGLKVPTLVVAADADMAPPSHYVEVFGLLDGGKRDGGWDGRGSACRRACASDPARAHPLLDLRVAGPGGGVAFVPRNARRAERVGAVDGLRRPASTRASGSPAPFAP